MVEVWRVPEWWAAEGGSESGAAGVNFKDICQRTGISAEAPPFVLGLEGAGTVEVLGEGVTGLAVGQRVAWEDAPGSCAGKVVLHAERAVPVPDRLRPPRLRRTCRRGTPSDLR
ncbi:alcohol dehydrogenase catalytic domain-containing protein [Streptomyces sp. NPDC059218]|uniref:alcohol dehydrogenase catalytic domain-containing protein n=1 Tax=unclassified Streptomyces TaxID=2593676 RepID=UPI0036A73D63